MMKRFVCKTFAVLVLIGSTLALQAHVPDGDDKDILRKQIVEHLENPDLRQSGIEKSEVATVQIHVNAKKEMVVLEVDTKSDFVEDFVKNRLNYQQIKETISTGRYIFKLVVRDGSIKA